MSEQDAGRRGIEGLGKNRIEALADGIFAVAMTLLVLDIKSAENLKIDTTAGLLDYLATLEHSFMMYAISFVVLAMFWIGHHLQFHFVRHMDRQQLWINMAFLLLITLIPFSTDLLGDHGHLPLPVFVYGANLLALAGLLHLHLARLVRVRRLALPGLDGEVVTHMRRQLGLFALVPVASIAAAFYSPRLGMYLYFLLAIPAFAPGRIDRLVGGAPADGAPNRLDKP